MLHFLLFVLSLFLFAVRGLEFFALLLLIGVLVGLKGYVTNIPGEVLLVFILGRYGGRVEKSGFFWVTPFFRAERVSVRRKYFNGTQLRLRDAQGTPVLASVNASWRIENAEAAYFMPESPEVFFRFQADKSLKEVLRKYRMEVPRRSSKQISLLQDTALAEATFSKILSKSLAPAGIVLCEANFTQIDYAPEVAASFQEIKSIPGVLTRQNALAEGALKIAERILMRMETQALPTLSEEQKADFIQNLVVAICGGNNASPK